MCKPSHMYIFSCRNMSNNAISGPLPTNWGYGNVFTQLQIVTLDNNQLNGSLPAVYNQGLRSLIVLNLDNNNFSGERQVKAAARRRRRGIGLDSFLSMQALPGCGLSLVMFI